MESTSLQIIRRVRREIVTADIPYREYIAITRLLDVIIEELANAHPPTLSTNPREVPGSGDQ